MKLHISNSGDIGKRCGWFLTFFLSLAVLLFIAMPGTVLAANIVVNSTVDLQPPVSADGYCTLREAIYNANTTSDTTGGDCAGGTGDDTITFDFSVPGTIDLGTYGALSINDSAGRLTTIDGESLGRVVITGGTNSQVFAVSGVVTLRNLIIQDSAKQPGISSNGTLTIENSTLSGNSGANGGGISNRGTIDIINSTLSGNQAVNGGGEFTTMVARLRSLTAHYPAT